MADFAIGGLTVVFGCTNSGKSEVLKNILRRLVYSKKNGAFIKKGIKRGNNTVKTSYWKEGRSPIITMFQEVKEIPMLISKEVDVVLIDDGHFFDRALLEVIAVLLKRRLSVVVAGLNMNCNGETFNIMGELAMRADTPKFLSAVCTICGNDNATRSQRIKKSSLYKEGKAVGVADFSKMKVGSITAVCTNHFIEPSFESELILKSSFLKRKRVFCGNCGYQFRYSVDIQVTMCPDCGTSFTNLSDF